MSNIEDELLIQELEESVKQDQYNKMWSDYGPYLIAGAVIIVLVTAFSSLWRNHEARTNAHNTEIILSALGQDNSVDILSNAAGALKPDQRFLALFIAAGQLVQDKDYDGAVVRYKKIAADERVSPVLRDLAMFMVVRTEWAFATRSSDAGVYLGKLKPLISDDTSPWRYHAAVQAAMITAHDQQDYKKARQYLMPVLGGSGVSPSLLERARAMDHIYYLKQQNVTVEIMEEVPQAVLEEHKG